VGRTVPVKDYNTLLHAFSTIVKDNRNIRLMIVGDGPEDSSLKELAKSLSIADYVIFTGNRDDVPALLSAMDVFCLSSIREGLSNTLLEAHAAGLPSVVTETGGNAEIVKAGITGYLVPVGDVDAMGSAMRCLATDDAKRQELGAAARRRAAARFSLDAMVGNYEELYERVAACG
jgi:glycosyltransferase involved in cell wall biosynthesis